jgi:hypothetical protein
MNASYSNEDAVARNRNHFATLAQGYQVYENELLVRLIRFCSQAQWLDRNWSGLLD